jgi:hypothetical protein
MEKMEGKTESLEMVNENNGWLIIEFKLFLVQHYIFWRRDSVEKMEGKTEYLEMVNENNRWLIVEFKTLPRTTCYYLVKGLDGKDGG